MGDGRTKRLAQLQLAYESGILDEDTYQATATALEVQQSDPTDADNLRTESRSAEGSDGAQRSVAIGGDAVDNIIITGDDNTYLGSVASLTIQSLVFQASPEPGKVDPKQLLWTYLNQVVYDTGTLQLAGVDRKMLNERDEARLELASVYTDLDTVRFVEKELSEQMKMSVAPGVSVEEVDRNQQSALTFINEQRYAVLLGDPGSGKTTFANFLALCLAGELLGLVDVINLERLGKGWTAGALLPVHVVVRHFAAQFPDQLPDNALWDYLKRRLDASLHDFVPLLRRHLIEEGGLLIVDGLDEAPEIHRQRELVKGAVLAFKRQFPRVRILLTSRTYAYQHQQWRLPDFVDAVLAPFAQEQINLFVERWYVHMAKIRHGLTAAEAQGRATLLKQAIQRSPHLRELAPRPLLLTLMASLHAWWGGSLPEEREQLYADSVDLLLDMWERPKVVLDVGGKPVLQAESMAEWLRYPQRVRAALEKLAYEIQSRQKTPIGAADIAEGDLVVALMRAANDPDLKPERVIEYIRDRAGLLTNRGEGVYSFPHHTFQEYLAARYLTDTGFPTLLVKLVREEPDRWREVLLLAGAKVARGTPYAAWSLVTHLCTQPCEVAQVQAATDRDWLAVFLAGQLLVETGIYKRLDLHYDEVNLEILGRVRSWLTALVTGGHLTPVDRVAAGRALGWLGDERPGVGVKDGRPDMDWVMMEAGTFVMGSDRRQDFFVADDETPQFTCTFTTAYWISRYPITVAHYRRLLRRVAISRPPTGQKRQRRGAGRMDGYVVEHGRVKSKNIEKNGCGVRRNTVLSTMHPISRVWG